MKFVVFGVITLATICAGLPSLKVNPSEMLARGINRFSFDLFTILARDNRFNGSDLVLSPLSTYALLSTTYLLARTGDNYEQIKNALYLPDDGLLLMAVYEFLAHEMKRFENVTMNMANKLYIPNKYDSHLLELGKRFNVDASTFDPDEPRDTVNAINKWVDNSTNHLIKNMMTHDYMNECNGITLASVGYFEGDWKYPFNKYLTKDRDFHVNERETKKVPMMFLEKTLTYGELPGLKARFVKLPYKNANVEILIVLPDEINGLENILAHLHNFKRIAILEAAKKAPVRLYLPKFKVASDTYVLNDYLKELGMTNMFEKRRSNFLGLHEKIWLKVNSVLQKPLIKINEAGTTTKSEPLGWDVSSPEESVDAPKVTFDVDRPFYYQISYNDTIMFQGATFFGARRAPPLIKQNRRIIPDIIPVENLFKDIEHFLLNLSL